MAVALACCGLAAGAGCGSSDTGDDEDGVSALQLSLHGRPVPELVAPEDGAVLGIARPLFRWRFEHHTQAAVVQLCSVPDCATVVQTFTTVLDRGSPKRDLTSGRYYWRVAASHGHSGIHAWSDIRRFDVVLPGVPLTNKDLLGVWSVAADDVWAVGADGIILHYDGTWTVDSSPTTQDLRAVWAGRHGSAWAVGAGGTIVRRAAGAWAASPSPVTSDLRGVWASGPNDAWAAGDEGRILHWNGATWTLHHDRTAGELRAVWGRGPGDVWVVGGGREPDGDYASLILHWDGAAWSESYVCNPEGTRFAAGGWVAVLDDVWGVGGRTPWAAGSCHPGGGFVPRAFVVRRKGGSWIEPPTPPSPLAEFRPLGAIWGSGAADVWVASPNLADATHVPTMMHFDGAGWTASAQSITVGIHDLGGTARDDIWAVGVDGKRLHFDGAAWTPSP